MGYSRLGAEPVEVAKQTIYQGQLVQPVVYPISQMPYGYGSRFYRSQATSPSQPYITHFDPAEVERAVYKDLPTEVKKKPSAAGTEPQKMIKLRSGLEVPQYIIQRDFTRKKNEKIAAAKYLAVGVDDAIALVDSHSRQSNLMKSIASLLQNSINTLIR